MTTPPSPIKVLIVEDTTIAAKIAQIAFQDKGCIAVVAESGEEALAKIDASFHLILMDLGLPYMNGFETAKAIRKHCSPQIASIPIYALTAHISTLDTEAKLHDSGMNGLFVKPLTLQMRDDLLTKI